jgi:hypothetical protein
MGGGRPLVVPSSETTTGSIVSPCFHSGPSKRPVLSAIAGTSRTEALPVVHMQSRSPVPEMATAEEFFQLSTFLACNGIGSVSTYSDQFTVLLPICTARIQGQ